ncbi:hypothetical protein TIFTF001_049097 [Ficus carica]|uniref:Uncharacterized protein n=1 Tax=Ficus carica TaxID=3494 RepID=A0AA88CMC8_FICCA|nr:hypothetical protein TIFTF001_049075 [Ficus carica]GMN23363.1 hypothetical protein TIFTF001_049076 [Ficus carica]GMN23582.1 hypothetical protein TIFTF001_049096 [Ficus carica]GMN23601.1 hypothetical protein TIFTF001_049097 [Ficus carica]
MVEAPLKGFCISQHFERIYVAGSPEGNVGCSLPKSTSKKIRRTEKDTHLSLVMARKLKDQLFVGAIGFVRRRFFSTVS